MAIVDAENLAEFEFNYKPADEITISDAILACNVISSFELRETRKPKKNLIRFYKLRLGKHSVLVYGKG